ncbi:multidrug export protein MepA [Lachnospiraceae bacterium]|nr:multidrug export protein MepA [Lachnospiraceae bacterium]
MRKDKDMTVGNPFKLIGAFSFSLIIGNLFQQLYTFVDTIVIGKKIGTLGLAAVGGTEWLIFLVNGVIIGLVQGFCILLGNSFGEGNEQKFEIYFAGAKRICFVLAIVLTVVFLLVSGVILQLLGTKDEVYTMAREYTNILFLGIPFLVFYQLFSGALRSRGNSKIPLLAMTISSLCNIVFDILFVNILEFGIAGAALATILSECVVMLICGYYYYKEKRKIDNYIEVYHDKLVTWNLIKMGTPMALQSVITSIGGLIVVNRINQYDITFLAGYTAAVKLYGLLEIAASSFGMAVVAYVAQNYGAGKLSRIREGVRASLIMGVIVALVCSGVMIFGGKDILRLFIDISDTTEKTLWYGNRFLKILAIFFPLLYSLYILRAALQGINNTIIPMVSSFAQLLMRLFCTIVLTRFIGSDGIFWGEVFAWIFADIILFMHTSTQLKFVSGS